MSFTVQETLFFPARWTTRLALFAIMLLVVTLVLHRFFGLPTLVAATMIGASFVFAGLGFLLALAGGISIWNTGRPGAARVIMGLFINGVFLATPLAALPLAGNLPMINDVTTDTITPPEFVELAKQRSSGLNSPAYAGEEFAKLQMAAYPDLKTLAVDRPLPEVFEVTTDALQRLGFEIVRAEAPDPESGRTALLEATDRTIILGFYDDVAVRITGTDQQGKIDIRSQSRIGRHDFGRNAERVRRILKEIVARLEATVPTAETQRLKRMKERIDERDKVKRPEAANQKKKRQVEEDLEPQ
jgi:hypothetical protein